MTLSLLHSSLVIPHLMRNLTIKTWIPAYAGRTKKETARTKKETGMTKIKQSSFPHSSLVIPHLMRNLILVLVIPHLMRNLTIKTWIPAYAGRTKKETARTKRKAGRTKKETARTKIKQSSFRT